MSSERHEDRFKNNIEVRRDGPDRLSVTVQNVLPVEPTVSADQLWHDLQTGRLMLTGGNWTPEERLQAIEAALMVIASSTDAKTGVRLREALLTKPKRGGRWPA